MFQHSSRPCNTVIPLGAACVHVRPHMLTGHTNWKILIARNQVITTTFAQLDNMQF